MRRTSREQPRRATSSRAECRLDSTLGGPADAFAAKLAPAGDALEWITLVGGANNLETASGIGVDSSGDAYITGSTNSDQTTFPLVNAFQATRQGDKDAFLTKLRFDPDTDTLSMPYSTYIGGTGTGVTEDANAIAVQSDTKVYITGTTANADYDVTTGTHSGNQDAFVSRFNTDLSGAASLVKSQLLGGVDNDQGRAIALLQGFQQGVVIAGATDSGPLDADPKFPGIDTSPHAYGGGVDAFVSEVTDGGAIATSYYGGGGTDVALGVAAEAHASKTGATADGFLVLGVTDGETPQENAFATDDPDASANLFLFKVKLGNSGTDNSIFASYLGPGTTPAALGLGLGYSAFVAAYGVSFPTTAGAYDETGPGVAVMRIDPSQPVIDQKPARYVTSGDVQFTFNDGTWQGAAFFACSFEDNGVLTAFFTGCSSPLAYTGLVEGEHTFQLVMEDAARSPSEPVNHTFTVDLTNPQAFELTSPAEGALTALQPTFTWQPANDGAGSGIDRYDLLIDGSVVTTASGDCAGGTCQATAPAALVTGARTWQVRAVDRAGRSTSSATRSFTAAEPPIANLVISPNPALVGRPVTFDGSASPDASHVIARYEWDLDGDGSYETDTGATPTASRSYDSARTIDVGLRVTDSAGLTGATLQQLRVTAAHGIAGQLGVTINNGAQYTRSPNVTVSATFPAGTTGLLFSNDGGFLAPQALPAQKDTKWRLESSGPERLPKIVYVRFVNGPFTSDSQTDDIILDETPPRVTQAAVTPLRPGIARAAAARRWRVRLRAVDSNSGVKSVQVTSSKRRPGRALRYRRKLTVRSAKRPVWIRARDKAGNNSRWRRAR